MIGRSKFVSPSNAYHKCKKFLAHMFGYDAFGNVRTTQGVGADATGGDFRFQGQWLESATGIYHFRARDYDSKTGTFLSRDPVDPTAQDPEALNLYQFVYNNPYVYSDPSEMFTLLELNAGQKIQATLRTYAQEEARSFLKDKVGEAFSQIATTIIDRLLPGSFVGDILDRATDTQTARAGGVLERFLQNNVCRLLPNTLSDLLWLTPEINSTTGKVKDPGFSCDKVESRTGNPLSNPDFLFEKGGKRPFTQADPYNRKYNPYSILVGDVKITTANALDAMEDGSNQWKAMSEHAATYQSLHFVSYVTFKYARSGGSLQATQQRMQQIAVRKGVHLFVAVLFD